MGQKATDSGTATFGASKKRTPRWNLLIILAVVLVALIGGGVYTAMNLPSQCGLFGSARHGLPCDIPLPANSTFVSVNDIPPSALSYEGDTGQEWSYSVANSTAIQLRDLYSSELSAHGWQCAQSSLGHGAASGLEFVTATRGGGTTMISAQFDAQPDGVSTSRNLNIILQTSSHSFPCVGS